MLWNAEIAASIRKALRSLIREGFVRPHAKFPNHVTIIGRACLRLHVQLQEEKKPQNLNYIVPNKCLWVIDTPQQKPGFES